MAKTKTWRRVAGHEARQGDQYHKLCSPVEQPRLQNVKQLLNFLNYNNYFNTVIK